jgi:hypothetical protein
LEETVAAPVKKTENTTGGIRCADHATPPIRKSWHYFAKKRRPLGRHSSLADQSHSFFFCAEGISKITKNAFGPRCEPRPPEYEGVLTTGSKRLALVSYPVGLSNLKLLRGRILLSALYQPTSCIYKKYTFFPYTDINISPAMIRSEAHV